MNTFSIGICGPVIGLSKNQYVEIGVCLREVLKTADRVSLCVWRDTSSRHPLGDVSQDGMIASAAELERQVRDRIDVKFVEYIDVRAGSFRMDLELCDILFICPGHAHTITAKSRVNKVRKYLVQHNMKHRVSYPWVNELQSS